MQFADPADNRYPIDTEEPVLAAWSCITEQANADKYEASERNGSWQGQAVKST